MTGSLRPGFHLQGSYSEHKSPVRQVVYNPKTKYYVSLDDKCMRAWRLDSELSPNVRHLTTLNFPASQPSFVTRLLYEPVTNLLFASALDDCLKLYDTKLTLKGSLGWKAGAVMAMAYNWKLNELITGGSHGVKVWYSEPAFEDDRAKREVVQRNCVYDSKGRLIAWSLGKHQHIRERMTLNVPGASTSTAAASRSARDRYRRQGNDAWCSCLVFHDASQLVFVPISGNVYGFSMRNGERVFDWEGLHTQPVTSLIYIPDQLTAVTSSQDASVVQWRIMKDKSLQQFKKLPGITSPVSSMVLQPDQKALLTATLDGMVTLWSLSSLEAMFRMKIQGAVVGLQFQTDETFCFHHAHTVKVMRLRHIFTTLRTCNSEPVHLKLLDNGRVLAVFDDGCIRIMDQSAQDVVTIVPQLSTKAVLAAEFCMDRSQLIVLLANGHVHVWSIHSRRPPKLQQVWHHLAKDSPCSMVLLPAKHIPSSLFTLARGAGGRVHHIDDHVVLGTSSGEVIVCDQENKGRVTVRAPIFEKQSVTGISLDTFTGNLVAFSKACVKVLRLNGLRCACELRLSDYVSRVNVVRGRALIGGVSGALTMLDLCSGRHMQSERSGDHTDLVTAISGNEKTGVFLTASRDGSMRVVDRDQRLIATVLVAAAIKCVCFLNEEGDILVGVGTRFLMSPAKAYRKGLTSNNAASSLATFGRLQRLDDLDHDDTSDSEVPLHTERSSSGFKIWQPEAQNATQMPAYTQSIVRKSLIFENFMEVADALSARGTIYTPSNLSPMASGEIGTSYWALRNRSLDALDANGGGDGDQLSLDPVSEKLPPMKYSVDLDIPQPVDEKSPRLRRILSKMSSLFASDDDDEHEQCHEQRQSRHQRRQEGRIPQGHSESEETESHSTSGSDLPMEAVDDRSEGNLEGLEGLFKMAAPVVASRRAFYPGIQHPAFLVRALSNRQGKGKKKKKKRRRRRKKKRAISAAGMGWEDRAEQLRKAAMEDKVILGVHELLAQESGTKSAVECVLPKVGKLAGKMPAQPSAFVPRKAKKTVTI